MHDFLTRKIGRYLAPLFVWFWISGLAFAGSQLVSVKSGCEERWSILGIHLGMTEQAVLDRFPVAKLRQDDRGQPYYRVELSQPFDELDVRKARLGLWFDASGDLEVMTVSLRGRAAYEDVALYFEHELGKPDLLTSATYGTWWGGLRSRGGTGWKPNCGLEVRLERWRFDRAGLVLARADDVANAGGEGNR